MGVTKIEWTSTVSSDGTVAPGYTFNPWIGCTKVSDGCKFCYAETMMDKRYGKVKWGPTGERVRTSDSNWAKPLAWDRKALAEGRRYRVFCASLADVFEDNPQVNPWRYDLFALIAKTPMLDWLLLTKRPENVNDMVPGQWRNVNRWPENVWIGTSVENQAMADKRIPELIKVPAQVRFLSCEPLLGPVDLATWFWSAMTDDHKCAISWAIVGGESGPKARPMDPDWARSLRGQCALAGVAFHFKQWGGVHKSETGRVLDGRTWDEYPQEYDYAAQPIAL